MKRVLAILLVVVILFAGIGTYALMQLGPTLPPPPKPDTALTLDEDVRSAIESHYEAVLNSPRNAEARAQLAMVYDAARIFHLAEPTYEQAIQLDHDVAEWWYHLGRMREEQGNHEGAFFAIDRAASLAPDQYIISVRKGMWLLDTGEVKQADAAFRQALQLKNDSLAARHGLATALVSQEQYAAAVPILEQLRTAIPTDSTVRQLLGRCYLKLGKSNEGASELSLGVSSKWDWTVEDAWIDHVLAKRTGYRAQFERAMSFLNAGDPSRAAMLLEELRADRPGDVPSALALAAAFEATGQVDRAIALLAHVDSINPGNFAIKLNLGHFHQLKNDLARAMHFTNEAIALNPTLASGHVQKGRIYLMQNQVEQAEAAIDEATRCDAGNADARFLKAQVFLNRRQFAQAVQVLEEATRMHPHMAQGFALLAVARYNAGNAPAAMQALSQAERIDPNNSTVQSIRRQLGGASAAPNTGRR